MFNSDKRKTRKEIEDKINQTQQRISDLEKARFVALERYKASVIQKWEYKQVTDESHNLNLDQFGAYGWELVSVATYETGSTQYNVGNYTVHTLYIFKRPIVEIPDDLLKQIQKKYDIAPFEAILESLSTQLNDLA